jgi:hypothetical protein
VITIDAGYLLVHVADFAEHAVAVMVGKDDAIADVEIASRVQRGGGHGPAGIECLNRFGLTGQIKRGVWHAGSAHHRLD